MASLLPEERISLIFKHEVASHGGCYINLEQPIKVTFARVYLGRQMDDKELKNKLDDLYKMLKDIFLEEYGDEKDAEHD